MSKLLLYSVFHGNLNFSYVPEDLYPQILHRCYWPLLRIIEDQKVALGLEFSAYTLEIVNRLDPAFVKRLKELWHDGQCEFIGSGLMQSIMPLIPAEVNRKNLKLGNEVYERLLGRTPKTAYVNELVYSASLPGLYKEAGYETLIVNWESALPAHKDPELLYRPCSVPLNGTLSAGTQGADTMPIIWHSTIIYRNFQRYVEREIPWDEYLACLLNHMPQSGERCMPIYSSDWEVFDFKPWQVHPDGFQAPDLKEMERISGLFTALKDRDDLEFVLPSDIVQRSRELPLVHPESAAYPLTYKKQDNDSVTRWAVSGRENARFNTQCHQLYEQLQLADWRLAESASSTDLYQERDELWQELCFLWSSDFRTFATEDKYVRFRNSMGAALDRAARLNRAVRPSRAEAGDISLANCSPVSAESEPIFFTINTNGSGGTGDSGANGHKAYQLRLGNQIVPCQVAQQVPASDHVSIITLVAQPSLAEGGYSTGMVRPVVGADSRNGATHLVDTERHIMDTGAVRLSLLPDFGGAIGSLSFPGISTEPLIHSLTDSPESMLLSGDLTLDDRSGKRITDHLPTTIEYPSDNEPHELFVPVRCAVATDLGTVWKTYRVYRDQPRVDLSIRFQWRDVVPKSFRLGRVVINPSAFDRDSLQVVTVNGGETPEEIVLAGQHVSHDEMNESGVTAHCCLGATEGWAVLKDSTKGIGLITRPAKLYSVPLLHYDEHGGSQDEFLLTLTHSLDEWDETSHTLWRGHSTWEITILGGGDDVVAKTRASALLANGGLVTWNETTSQ